MTAFIQLVDKLDAVNSANEKIALIEAYLKTADPSDAAWAAWLLMDQRRRRTVTSRALRRVFSSCANLPPWLLDECYAHVGDTAETVTLLIRAGCLGDGDALGDTEAGAKADRGLEDGEDRGGSGEGQCAAPPGGGKKKNQNDEELAALTLGDWMEREIPALAELSEEERGRRITGWWRAMPSESLFVLNKLLTGGFRLGVSRTTVVKALARAAGVSAPAVTAAVTAGFTPSAGFFAELRGAAEHNPKRPYPFYLASPFPENKAGSEALERWRIEWKWDGIRAQIIRRRGEVTIWSRGEDIVSEQFPEVAEAAEALPEGSVLDCALAAWNWNGAGDGGALPFNVLQRRLGRKRVSGKMIREVPVAAVVFDCLEAGGEDLRALPLEKRLEARDTILAAAGASAETGRAAPGGPRRSAIFKISEQVHIRDWEHLEAERRGSAGRNVEGLMLKRLGSPYRSGRRRGDWWKFKRDPFTLDAVLIYAQAGSGKRANLFTDYTFALRRGEALVPFAKAYSGLSNEEIAELDRWIRRNTTDRFGPVRQVKPERVFEIAFEGIGPSTRHKSGVATRFPRILRPRPEKDAAEINTLDDAKALIR